MQLATTTVVQSIDAFTQWLAKACADVEVLAGAIAQHATPAGVELISVALLCGVTGIAFIVWISRRTRQARIIRVRRNRYATAISGQIGFQEAKAGFAKAIVTGEVVATARTGETRGRVETKVMDVAPRNEQYIIDLLAHFKWYLKSSSPVHTTESHPETRGDKEYWVTTETNYVHLVFERDLDEPNIDRIRALEYEYFLIVIPHIPSYAGPIIVGILGLFTGVGAIIILPLCIWWGVNISKRREIARAEGSRLRARQIEILEECDRL